MQDSTRISVIIPVYIANKNLKQMTDECVSSFFATTPSSSVELIIVDDGSPEPYELARNGKVVHMDENSGYSRAVNTGLQAAQGEILVIGNNDLTFHQNWLTELLFPLYVGYDIATCWSSDQLDRHLAEKLERDAKFGCLLAMTRHAYETLGGFNEAFRGYFTDLDMWKRAQQKQIAVARNNSMVIEHKAKATYQVVDTVDYEYEKAKVIYQQIWGDLD